VIEQSGTGEEGFALSRSHDQGLQTKPPPLATGSVQRGPRFVVALGRVMNATGAVRSC
jgi:hypothetical protein